MIKKILKTSTIHQSSITLLGTVLNGILGMFFYILVARNLGPVDFGLLIVAITTMTLVADISDLGTNTGLVRFVSGNLKSNPDKAYKIAKLSLYIKMGVYLLVLLVGMTGAGWIAGVLFQKPELETPLRFAFFGVGGAMLFSYMTSLLQSFESFKWWSFLNISMNLVRVVIILGLVGVSLLNISNTLIVYVAVPFLGFLVGCLLLPVQKIVNSTNIFDVASEFYKFNRWVAVFVCIAAISSRLDVFFAGRFLTDIELGQYGAANQLASILSQLVAAFGVVVAPKFASFDTKEKMISYLKKTQLLVLGLGLGVLVVSPLAYFLIPLTYGDAYLAMMPILLILVLSGIIFLLSVPIHNSLIYYYGRSDIFVWVAFGHVLVMGISGWYLIQLFGVIGLASAVVMGSIFNLAIPTIWWWRLQKK
jgi:O-antigen/teichoic acid export membrane protein